MQLTFSARREACCPRAALNSTAGVRMVDATSTPPGFSTRAISARPAAGSGQQCKAAPAWMASTEPLEKGRRPMSARTAISDVLQSQNKSG